MTALDELIALAEGVTIDQDDLALAQWIWPDDGLVPLSAFGSKGLLDRSAKKNWVEEHGGLPGYIEEVANALHTKRGMTISHAIAAAISRMKIWAVKGTAEVKAKAIKALAQWEALKAKARAKKNG